LVIGAFNLLDWWWQQQKTDAEDRCQQAYHYGWQRIRGYAKQRVELDSLSTYIEGLSTTVAQSVDRCNSGCRQWSNPRVGSIIVVDGHEFL